MIKTNYDSSISNNLHVDNQVNKRKRNAIECCFYRNVRPCSREDVNFLQKIDPKKLLKAINIHSLSKELMNGCILPFLNLSELVALRCSWKDAIPFKDYSKIVLSQIWTSPFSDLKKNIIWEDAVVKAAVEDPDNDHAPAPWICPRKSQSQRLIEFTSYFHPQTIRLDNLFTLDDKGLEISVLKTPDLKNLRLAYETSNYEDNFDAIIDNGELQAYPQEVTNDGLQMLTQNCKKLEKIILGRMLPCTDNSITGRGILALAAACSSLHTLVIFDSSVLHPDDFSHIANHCMQIVHLHVIDCPRITTKTLELCNIKKLPRFQSLGISHLEENGESYKKLRTVLKHCENLRSFHFDLQRYLGNEPLNLNFGEITPKLDTLFLSGYLSQNEVVDITQLEKFENLFIHRKGAKQNFLYSSQKIGHFPIRHSKPFTMHYSTFNLTLETQQDLQKNGVNCVTHQTEEDLKSAYWLTV